LTKTGAELTTRANDYLKPSIEGADKKALADAVMSIPAYAEIVQKLKGKKLNIALEANGLAKTLNLTDPCALVCAKTFESSLKFAGMLSADSTVSGDQTAPIKVSESNELPKIEKENEEEEKAVSSDTQSHTLYLDKTKSKRFTVTAPLAITPAEIKRIQKWIEVTLLIESDESEQGAST
jgi:hypothetical protein